MLQSVELVQRHSTSNEGVFVFKEVAAILDVVPDEVPPSVLAQCRSATSISTNINYSYFDKIK